MDIDDIIAKVGEDRISDAVDSEDADALKNLFEEEGIELNDEQLDYIAGGANRLRRPLRRRRSLAASPKRKRNASPPPQITPNNYGDKDDPNSPNWTDDEIVNTD